MSQDDVPTVRPEGRGDAAQPLPASIGRYRIVSVLGRGGMGIVYEAEQSRPHRPVALKVILGGSYVDDLHIRLFEREVETLARLKHPNIATIYEAGRTEEGQHFFAMELVRGTTLDRFVVENDLTRRDRLELFGTICAAINHAHQRGVIHRDLKPSNILVDADGQPKVLDFGLARITDWDLNATTMLTRPGNIVGTLTHMSPEQARGDVDAIDVRSDVYALGVILYQLMTDKLPVEWDQRSLPAGITAILERDPPKPSTIDRRLRGDLDTIIMKTLEKDPPRRYQSAAALGDDVERYLTHQPILARPAGTFYQFRKLVARHKLPFALLAAILVIAIGFGVWTRALYLAEREQHAVATDNLETATFVSDFMIDMFDVSDPDARRSGEITARELLENAADKIDEQEGRPEVQIDLMLTMGRVYRRLGDYDRALALFEDARRVGEAIDPEHPKVAESLQEMGWVRKSRGDYEAAESHLRQSIELRRRSLGDPYPGLSTDLMLLSGTLLSRGDYDAAESLAREALAVERAATDPDEIEISRILGKLGSIRMDLGDHVEAERLFLEVLEIRRRLQGDDHPWVSDAMNSLAAVMQYGGNYDKAVDLAAQALAIRRESHGDDHHYTGTCLVWQGAFLRDQEEFGEAEPVLREALRVYRESLPPGHAHTASGLTQLGWLLFDTVRLDEAERSFNDAIEIYQSALGEAHTSLGRPMLGLARVHLARGEPALAEPLLRAALELFRGNYPEGHWQTASVENALGACLVRLDRCNEAGALVREGHRAMHELRGADDRYVIEARAFVDEFEQRCRDEGG